MKILSILPVCLFVSCVSTSNQVSQEAISELRKPNPSNKTYKPTGEWNIKSENDLSKLRKLGAKISKSNGVIIVDLNGITLDGSKQKGDGGQSEDQTPLLRARVPLILKNGFVDNNKNALVFYALNSGVERITWLDVGEDAVATFDGAKNFSIKKCEFQGAEDKSIQLNEADGAQLFDNTIVGGFTGVRLGEIDYTERSNKVHVGNNTFIGQDMAWDAAKLTIIVDKPNKYRNVKHPWNLVKGAKVVNKDE